MIVDQTDFATALLDPLAKRPLGLIDGAQRPAGRRFDVYRNNVVASLTEALETAFPVLTKLVGEQNFRALSAVYLREHPPSSPVMMFYGEHMPNFLSTFQPTSSIGYLPDVARLELAMRESYHASDFQPIDPKILQGIQPETLMASKLGLAPSLRLIRSLWPLHSIWRFNMVEGSPKPTMVAQDVAVLRVDMDPEPHLLPKGGGRFLEAVLNGRPLGEAYDAASVEIPDFDLSKTLAILLSAEALTSIGD